VRPGTILDDLRNAAEKYHLTFGPDPATHNHCTLGGMIGNNPCGIHSVMAGRTADNVEELEILTYDGLRLRVGRTSEAELERIIRGGGRRGEIYAKLKVLRDRYADLIRARYPMIPRRVSGYNLDELLPENGFHVARALVGSEGTCVTILEATVRLVHSPPAHTLVVLGYPDVYQAGDHIPEVMEHAPLGLEGIDDRLVGYIHKKDLHAEYTELLPPGGGWLLVEMGGATKEEANARAHELMAALKKHGQPPAMRLFDDVKQSAKIWEIRESGLGATAYIPGMPDTWPGWEDSAVPPERLGHYLRDLRELFEKYRYQCALYGHFGQGCVHVRIDSDLTTRAGIDQYLGFLTEAADLVVSYAGSLCGEHGDGQARAALLVFGALISPQFLTEISLSGYLFAALALLFVRPIALGIALVGSRLHWREMAAAAWFGPKGFASVVYGILILKAGLERGDDLFHLLAIVVVGSIIAHSSTDVVIARWFQKAEAETESAKLYP